MRRYVIHPGDYAIGENEKLYGDMAKKGWKLRRRGVYLSSFERCQPQELRYRIELSSPDLFDDDLELPDEQRALYEESGWQFVSRSGLINIFCAPAGDDAPEFYSDPRHQAATLKALRRSYLHSWIPPLLLLGLQLLFAAGMANDSVSLALRRWRSELQLAAVRDTAFVLMVGLLLLWGVYALLHGLLCSSLLYHRLKRGLPLDHEPKKRRLLHRAVNGALLLCCATCCLLALFQWQGTQRTPLPDATRDPYLLLFDLGYEGERSFLLHASNGNDVVATRSLAAQVWDARESMDCGDDYVWIYQDVYLLQNERQAKAIVPALMTCATFADGPQSFTPVSAPGLDLAYESGFDYIAVKGNCVSYITFSSGNDVDLLAALSAKWNTTAP